MPGLRFPAEQYAKDDPASPNGVPPTPVNKTTTSNLQAASGKTSALATSSQQLVFPGHSTFLEQVVTSRKGLGMIAARDIKRGTRIISEEPLLTMDTDNDKRLLKKLLQLSPSQHDQLTKLFDGKKNSSPEVSAIFADELRKCHQYNGRYLTAAVRDFTKMHSIFYTNAVMMGPEGKFGFGVFPIYSYLNHSCTPNVQNSFNATIGREVVHVIRDIQKGEEISTSYIPLQRPAKQRMGDLLEKWGFQCECATCCGADRSVSEHRRQRLYEIDQGFALLDKVDHRIYASAFMQGMIPKNDGEALRWAEESLELLMREDLVGMDMAGAYRECSKYSLREGQLEKALGYARKELDVQITCLGEDTAHLSGDDDANAWLKHINSMTEADKVRMRMNEKRVQKEQKKVDKKAAKKAAKR